MLAKNDLRLCSQPTPLSCRLLVSATSARVSQHKEPKLNTVSPTNTIASKPIPYNYYNLDHYSAFRAQQGASTWLMALFIVAILVTAIVAALLGHKLGYQRGYYSIEDESKQVAAISEKITTEIKDLRISNKILTTQAATAKQELTIGLSNLDELRQKQRELQVESSQVEQLNELYASLISKKGGMPLQVLGAKIEPLPENAFEYGFDVGMLSQDDKSENLTVTLTLQDDDNFVEVPLEPASFMIKGIVRIRGRFVMPAGFKPLQVKLNLSAADQEVEQLYDWTIGDMVDNMPLSLMDLPEVDQSPISSDPKNSIETEPSKAEKSKADK